MKMNYNSNHRARRGLTLIELVVVLVILVALAGLLLPLFPSMIDRAHTSTTASNITEVAKSIQLYEAMNLRSPDGFDSLINASNGVLRTDRFTPLELTPAPNPELDGDGDPILDGDGNQNILNQGAIDRGARISDALRRAGITTSYVMADPVNVPSWSTDTTRQMRFINTFAPYDGNNTFDLLGGGSVVVLGPNLNEITRLGLPVPTSITPTSDSGIQDYVVFGVGARTTMIANTMAEAPVHFPGQGDLDPSQTYSRFAVVYAIPTSNSGPARFAAVAAIHGDHFDSLRGLQRDYFELSQVPLN